MNTRQYTNRKASKRVTRHPAYQSLRLRILVVMKERDELQRRAKRLEFELESARTAVGKLGDEVAQLKAEFLKAEQQAS